MQCACPTPPSILLEIDCVHRRRWNEKEEKGQRHQRPVICGGNTGIRVHDIWLAVTVDVAQELAARCSSRNAKSRSRVADTAE